MVWAAFNIWLQFQLAPLDQGRVRVAGAVRGPRADGVLAQGMGLHSWVSGRMSHECEWYSGSHGQ